jgi:CDP-glucose 4,6-dehydratase
MRSDLVPDVLSEAVHEIRVQRLDAGRARSELGWAPRFDLDEGLRRTIAWYRRFFGEPSDLQGARGGRA